MDDPDRPTEAGRPSLHGPLWHAGPPGGLPPDFVPLRLVLQGTEHGIELTRPDMVLGRHSEADVRLPLPDVSRRHCRFAFTAGRWHVFDLNSLNGTHVNGRRVKEAVLEDHDTVRIGGFTFEVSLQESHPTVALPTRNPGTGDVLGRIAGALPPEDGRHLRRAS